MNKINPFIFPGIADEVRKSYLHEFKTWNGLTLEIILETSSFVCGVDKDLIASKSRKHEVVRARTIFMIASRALIRTGVVQVGNFINRNHSTVSASYKRHTNWMCTYDEYAHLYNKTIKNCAKHIITYDC